MKRACSVVLGALAAAVTLAAQQQPGQQAPAEPPPVTFRVEVNYVEVDAVVTDARGAAVTDLAAADFEVIEDGKPQKVTAFSHVDMPVTRAERPLFAGSLIEPDVQTNATTEGRLYLIVLDDLHTTPGNTPRIKMALRQFLDRHFGANDVAAVVYTSGRAQAGQEFTNNPRLLQAAIDRLVGRGSAATQGFGDGGSTCARGPGTGSPASVIDPCDAERAFEARATMSTIRTLSEFMAGVRGRRKAMLFVSEGIDYDIHDPITNRSATTILDETRNAIAAATRGNVVVYPIDPRGLATFGDAGESSGSFGDAGYQSPARDFLSSLRLAQDSLRTIAQETGGFASLNRNDFQTTFDRIVAENSRYYVLGYYPSNERRDGRFRRIEVRVRRPGVQVRSRRGYMAPRGRAPSTAAAPPLIAAARDALRSPIAVGGLPLAVFAAPFKGTSPNAAVAVAVEMRVNGFTFTEDNGSFNNQVELVVASTSLDGRDQAPQRHPVVLTMKADTLARARERGFRLVTQVDVPPGRYQIRVAASEEGGQSGGVVYDLEVPDFYRVPLSMSGVALTSAEQALAPTVSPRNPLADFLPGPPTATREFSRDDELVAFAEFYENTPGGPSRVLDITSAIRAEGGRTVLESSERRSSTELQGGKGGYGVTARFPLRGLDPGLYVLRVEGRSRIGDKDNSVGRDVQFRVR